MTRRAIRPEIAQKAVDDIRRRLVVAFFLRLSEVEPCGMSSTFARIFLKLKSIFSVSSMLWPFAQQSDVG